MPQFDPSKPFTPVQGFDPAKPFTVAGDPQPVVAPVSADEPSDYWSGALKGAKEGITGGAKGFAEGMLHSPASFVKGIVSLLTTNPVTTVKDAVAAIERLPDAIKQAGVDPEAWGKGVGDLTGQTMIGMAAPRAIGPVGRGTAAVGRGLEDLGDSAAMRRIGTFGAAGAAMHGDLGTAAIAAAAPSAMGVGGRALQAVGKFMAGTPEAETAAASGAGQLKAILSSAEPIPADKFFELLRQVPPNERPAILAARQAAIQAGGEVLPASPFRTAPAAAEAPQAASPAAPEAAPVPAPQSAPSAAPVPAHATPVAGPMSRPAAMQAALKAFSEAQETPRPAEVSNAASLIGRGATPDQALKVVVGNRPTGAPAAPAAELSPAEAFNAKFGLAQPTVEQTKFPKGMRGKVGSAQSVTVPPADTPTPQELLQGGAAEADFARQYAAKQAAVDPYATTGYEDVPSHLVRSVKLSPTEEYALHWIKQDMESVPFTKHTWINQATIEGPLRGNAAGGNYDIVPGSAGAPIYQEIVGDVTGATRADVLKAIENLQQGKMTKLGELVLQKAKEVSNMTEAQLKKRFLTGPPHFSEISR